MTGTERRRDLAALYRMVEKDPLFDGLRDDAIQIVKGRGTVFPKVMFVGEAPGENEDLQGRPFVGRSGALLNETLATVPIEETEVFITNIVKYRPSRNRNPTEVEVNDFKPYLDEEVEILDPQVICPLGNFSMKHFLPGFNIGQVHGQLFERKGRKIIPQYHPAFVLRGGYSRKEYTEDFAILLKEIT